MEFDLARLQISEALRYRRRVSGTTASLGYLPERLLLDGGCGTSLIARGLDVRAEPTALWNITRPDEVRAVHHGFIEAGAAAIQTNTFVANRLALEARGISEVRACNLAAAAVAREAAAGSGVMVIGNIGPSGQVPPPQGDANLSQLEETFAEQASYLAAGGVDLLHIETMVHPKEMRAALRGAREGAPGMPVVVSIACRASGDSFKSTMGFAIDSMLAVAIEEKADGIGANCMLCPIEMVPLIELIVAKASVPVFAKPTIAPDGGAPLYPDEFAEGVARLFAAGARAVGGCCGTSFKDISTARRRLDRGYR